MKEQRKAKQIGEIVKEYRVKNGLSLREFASRTYLSHNYFAILERNLNPTNGKPPTITLEAIQSIANAMHISFDELIDMISDDTVISGKEDKATLNIQYSEDFHELEEEEKREVEKQTQDIFNALILQKKQEKLDRLNKKKEVDNED